jgi:hypothetical protein
LFDAFRLTVTAAARHWPAVLCSTEPEWADWDGRIGKE